MTDVYSKEKRSWLMSKVRSTGNKSTEGKLIEILKRNRLVGWRRRYPAFGKPDVAFPDNKIAIFVDGCFWHGCPKHGQVPESNKDFWVKKIYANKKRDRLVNATIKNKGWQVVRIWECQLKDKKPLTEKMNQLGKLLEKA